MMCLRRFGFILGTAAYLSAAFTACAASEVVDVGAADTTETASELAPADASPPDPGSDAAEVADVPDGMLEVQDDIDAISPCPVAVIHVDEGEQVIPQTVLHLHGDQSFSPSGSIVSYQWLVEQPPGSVSFLIPTGTFPNPIFEANIAGKYVFALEVIDSAGVKSCVPARQEIYVVPDGAMHIELSWDTPGDPDPTDEGSVAGTDLDLHFANPYASMPDANGDGAPDAWFDPQWDCYWRNPSPDWGGAEATTAYDPSLDHDDTDGSGPENVDLNIPEGGQLGQPFVYRVGVHYWDDKGFGASFATVRVYIYSALVFEVPDVELQPGDLWDVATVEWPSTQVRLMLGPDAYYLVTPAYPIHGVVKP